MTKNEIAADMKRYCGAGMVTTGQIAKYMGYKKNDSVWPIVQGLEKVGNRYWVRDVAGRLKEACKIGGG